MPLLVGMVKIALVGILAGGSVLNLSAAHNVVFVEFPNEPFHLLQAVNTYIFCAKGTSDESRWQKLNKSLHRVSLTVNGKYDAIREIELKLKKLISQLLLPIQSRMKFC